MYEKFNGSFCMPLMKNPNDLMTWKQKVCITNMLGFFPIGITSKGGASIAIRTIHIARLKREDINKVTIPAGAFCKAFKKTATDIIPNLASIYGSLYVQGVTVMRLAEWTGYTGKVISNHVQAAKRKGVAREKVILDTPDDSAVENLVIRRHKIL